MNELENVIRASPPVLLAMALVVLGRGIKLSPVPDWTIPLILPVFGGIVYPAIAISSSASSGVAIPVVYDVLVGIVCGGAAVGANQAWRQVNQMLDEKKTTTEGPK